jgi:hypothetical protein
MYEYAQGRYQVDRNPIDGWTLVHAGYGLAAGVTGVPMLLTLGAALIWEAIENSKRPEVAIAALPDWTPEENMNIVVDIIAALAGWGIGAVIAGVAK